MIAYLLESKLRRAKEAETHEGQPNQNRARGEMGNQCDPQSLSLCSACVPTPCATCWARSTCDVLSIIHTDRRAVKPIPRIELFYTTACTSFGAHTSNMSTGGQQNGHCDGLHLYCDVSSPPGYHLQPAQCTATGQAGCFGDSSAALRSYCLWLLEAGRSSACLNGAVAAAHGGTASRLCAAPAALDSGKCWTGWACSGWR